MKNLLKSLFVLLPFIVYSQNQNYVKTITYKTPVTQKIVSPTISQASQNITYFDGLGRPMQQIAGQQSNSGKDIITHIEYDGFGRQAEEYLPFKAETSDMSFDPAVKTKVLSYYSNPQSAVNGNPSMEATTYPFSRKEFEASPLNRVLKQAAPGNSWYSGSGHEIKMDYQTNGQDEVVLFTAQTSWNSTSNLYDIDLIKNGFYTPNELYKTITYDENTEALPSETNGSTVEFKNKEGQIVLKRTYGTVGAGTANEKHDTYYIYDIYGNLTYVIPPKAVDLISGSVGLQADITSDVVTASGSTLHLKASNSITLQNGFHAQAGSTFSAVIDNGNQTVLDNLCYQYKYDSRNRLVEKKLPGKQWEFILYDKLDRAVATGPVNSPFNDLTSVGWLVTKYDAFDRPILTAWLSGTVSPSDRKLLQDSQNGFASNFSETKTALPTNTTINGVSFRYSSVAWPTSDYHVLSVKYYDDYNFPAAPTIPANVADGQQLVYYNTTVKPVGMATGTWRRVAEASTEYKFEQDYILYDAKARPVRSYTKNFLGGYTCVDSKLDAFSGQLKYTITTHSRLENDTPIKTTEVYTYSDQDRLLTQTHQIGTANPELILNNTYDELGNLISKKVCNNSQNINYSYNIRGWLTGINDVASLTKPNDPKDLFAFKINYNTPNLGTGVAPLYNGNISETQWATNSDNGILRGYGYRYDNLNRLKEGIYRKGGVADNYNESLTYDKNGNIINLTRYGSLGDTTPILVDQLTYAYKNDHKSNQLMKVSDAIANNANLLYEFKDSASNAADDYGYDLNGNMTRDNNKNITEIVYNHLNLPVKITFAATGNILYLYNAAGQKVQKTVNEIGKPTTVTDYLGGYQYKTIKANPDITTLDFLPMVEGYIEPAGSSYNYIYQYKDHLGNVRLSFDKTLAIKEESNYYPFGAKQEGYNSVKIGVENKYKFLGQERQDELGLNWDTFRHRNYDYAIGRFFGVDPVSEEYMSISTYQFAHNNPVWKIEIEGLEGAPANGKPDTSNHEPIKVKNTPVQGFVGGGLIETKVIQKTTTEVVKDVAVQGTKQAGGMLMKGLGTIFAVLTDYMSPNFGRTNERPLKDFAIDEKHRVNDHKVEEKTIEETGIKRHGNAKEKENRYNHIFGKEEHDLDSFVQKSGSEDKAYDAVQKAANEALANGELSPNSKGILPNGDKGNIITVNGMQIRLIGGRVSGDQVIISSFSRKGL